MHKFLGNTVDFKGENKILEIEKLEKELKMHVKYVKQAHGIEIVVISDLNQNTSQTPFDCIITTLPNVAIGVYTADCIPLLISGPGIVVAVHLGRKGLLLGLCQKVLKKLQIEFGIDLSEIKCFIGPALGFDNHTAWAQDLKDVSGKYKDILPKGTHIFNNKQSIHEFLEKNNLQMNDMKNYTSAKFDAFLYLQDILIEKGIKTENIFNEEIDTFNDKNYHSYRRDYPNHGLNFAYISL